MDEQKKAEQRQARRELLTLACTLASPGVADEHSAQHGAACRWNSCNIVSFAEAVIVYLREEDALDFSWVERRFRVAELVRATREIIYGSGQRVLEGTVGMVQRMDPGLPVAAVLWDSLAEGSPAVVATSAEFLESATLPVAAERLGDTLAGGRPPRVCRECGCTDAKGPLLRGHWLSLDLCSVCASKGGA